MLWTVSFHVCMQNSSEPDWFIMVCWVLHDISCGYALGNIVWRKCMSNEASLFLGIRVVGQGNEWIFLGPGHCKNIYKERERKRAADDRPFKMAQMMLNERAMNVIYAQWNCLWIKPHIRKSIWMLYIMWQKWERFEREKKVRVSYGRATDFFFFFCRNGRNIHSSVYINRWMCTLQTFFGHVFARKKNVCWKWWTNVGCVCVCDEGWIA